MTFGKVKRGNREISVTSKIGEVKKYLVPLSKQILVQENDYVRAGTPLSDGAVTPSDILKIKGPTAVQEYIVNEVQDVYRMQGVKINDKHFEVIVRQMMRKVEISIRATRASSNSKLSTNASSCEENDRIWGKKVVVDGAIPRTLKPGQIITARKLRDENSAFAPQRFEVGGSSRRSACHIRPDAARYHSCRTPNIELHVGRFFPRDDEGAQRGCHQWKDRLFGRNERERDLRSFDSCRYGTSGEYGASFVGSKRDFEHMDKSLDARLEEEAAEDATTIKKAEEKMK